MKNGDASKQRCLRIVRVLFRKAAQRGTPILLCTAQRAATASEQVGSRAAVWLLGKQAREDRHSLGVVRVSVIGDAKGGTQPIALGIALQCEAEYLDRGGKGPVPHKLHAVAVQVRLAGVQLGGTLEVLRRKLVMLQAFFRLTQHFLKLAGCRHARAVLKNSHRLRRFIRRQQRDRPILSHVVVHGSAAILHQLRGGGVRGRGCRCVTRGHLRLGEPKPQRCVLRVLRNLRREKRDGFFGGVCLDQGHGKICEDLGILWRQAMRPLQKGKCR